jgi:hypothetical protein
LRQDARVDGSDETRRLEPRTPPASAASAETSAATSADLIGRQLCTPALLDRDRAIEREQHMAAVLRVRKRISCSSTTSTDRSDRVPSTRR